MKHLGWGYLFLSLGQVSIACNVITGKFLNQTMPVFTYVGARFFISMLIFGFLKVHYKAGIAKAGEVLSRKDWLMLAGQALTAGLLFNVLFFTGLDYTTATSAGIIASTLPGVLAILAFIFLGERINQYGLAGILLSVVGILIISLDNKGGASGQGSLFGDFMIFLSIIPEAYYSILGKQIGKKVTIIGSAFVVNLFAFIMLIPFMAYGLYYSDPTSWPLSTYALIFVGGLSSVSFFAFWCRGLELVPANTAGIFGGVLPVATCIMAVVFLGESFSWFDACGILCVFAALYMGAESNRKAKQKQLAEEAI
ncbi:MAG: DMT family transporter [Oligoflexales bacterium]|nr:DMT family transporter [Oligoflexales bacterium]